MIRIAKERELKTSVLIADDHNLVAEATAHILQATGTYDVTVVGTLLEARAAVLAQGGFDIVLLDLDMPGMEGAPSVEAMVRANRAGRVVILTAGTVEIRQSALFASGAAGVILKAQPFADILAAIDSILDGELYYPVADDRALMRMVDRPAMVPVALRN